MTGKEFLNSVLVGWRTVESKLEQHQRLKVMATKITGAISGTPTVSDKNFSRIESAVVNVLQQSDDVTDEVTNYFTLYHQAEMLIAKVPALDERLILKYRYLCGNSWQKIADKMQVSVRYVYKMHGRALETFEKIFSAGDKRAQKGTNNTLQNDV